jgi:hypothetical protein
MSGVLTDANSFERIQKEDFVMKCPECGEKHRWHMTEGQLAVHEDPDLPRFARVH